MVDLGVDSSERREGDLVGCNGFAGQMQLSSNLQTIMPMVCNRKMQAYLK
jgi:hypothetical protein